MRESTRRDLAVAALVEELELVLVVELLEHVGLELLVLADGLEDLLALLVAGCLDEVGDLGRVKLRDAPVREPQARGRHVTDEGLELGPRHERLVGASWLRARRGSRRRKRAPRLGSMPATRQAPSSKTSSTSPARTRRAVLTLIRLWPSTSARSSTSPGRRSNWARLSFVVEVCAPPASRRSMRLAGTNRSRPPIAARRPITGGSGSARSSRAMTSSTRPSRSPAESSSGLPANEERWRTPSGIAVT